MRVTFKRNDRRLILVGPNYVFDEGPGGSFFVRQSALFRNAHVDHESNRQRPIGLALESEKSLRHSILQDANVILPERRNIVIVLVRGGKQKVSEIGLRANYIDVLLRSLRLGTNHADTH